MAETFLTRVQGFTPLIDVLCEELNVITAAVYGVVWRYCQGPRGVCQASLERIGRHLDLDRRTVERHVKRLVEEGYLEDLTPGLRNRPHTYADTGRAEILGLVDARVHQREVDAEAETATEAGVGGTENTTKGGVGGTESTTEVVQKVPPEGERWDGKYHRGGTKSTMKREREDSRETRGEGVAAQVGLDLPDGTMAAGRLWTAALEALKQELREAVYETWVRDTHGISYGDGVLVVGVRSAYAKDWLENRLYGVVQRTVTAVAGRPTSVRFIVRRNGG